jgi:hypothetical protein
MVDVPLPMGFKNVDNSIARDQTVHFMTDLSRDIRMSPAHVCWQKIHGTLFHISHRHFKPRKLITIQAPTYTHMAEYTQYLTPPQNKEPYVHQPML